MNEIKADELEKLLVRRMGLIVGPGLTYFPGIASELSKAVAGRYGVTAGTTYLETADAAQDEGATDEAIRTSIREFFAGQTPSPALTHLAKAKWSAIISFSLDTHLENRLKREAERRLVRQSITILDDASQVPPPRTVPAYKLLGIAERERFAYSTSTYLLRKTGWGRVVKDFADRVKGSAVLCLGLGDCVWAFQELLAQMASEASGAPNSLLFLADDPLRENATIRRIIGQRSRIMTVRSGLGELVTAAAAADKKGYTPALPFAEEGESPFHELRAFRELAIVVNEHLTTEITADERQQLLELLFSPDIPSWAPIVHGLDFRRTFVDTLKIELARVLSSQQPEYAHTATVIHGRAASGKTVLLKRLAWELAKSGEVVIWLRPAFVGEAGQTIKHLFEKIARIKSARGKKLVVFMDDPVKSTSIQPRDVLAAAQTANAHVLLVAGFRSTDWSTRNPSDPLDSFAVFDQHELPDELDVAEWGRLPQYLVSLGICAAEEDALLKIRGVPSRQAQDTLSMLYYLLPQTRAMIASSIKDEFFRLGDRAWLTNLLLNTAGQSTALLKTAYEMVAVAGHFRSPLPLEVLVSALGVDYDTWLSATTAKGPAWGILYSEEFEEGETVCYRTRNELVTHILMDAINGGSLGHAGELDVMSRLVAACTGTTPVYREFCVRVLVQNPALEKYEFDDVLKLYDQALESLPFADKTILHHKARWIRKRGRDPIEAGRVLDLALDAKPYPYTRRAELDEHIHTTYAASIIDAIDQKKVAPGDGKQRALEHLDKARSTKYLDPRAVHVQANLIVKLAGQEGPIQSPDSIHLVGRALSELDRALLLMANPHAGRRQDNDVQMLESVRDQIFLAVGSMEQLKEQARKIWDEFRGQQGFVLAARKLFQAAVGRNKGSLFKKALDYCQLVMNDVRRADIAPSPALHEVAIHIYYKWQIQRAQLNALGFRIEWERIEDYCRSVLAAPAMAPDPFYRYLLGLSLAHRGQWPQANAILSDVRNSGVAREFLWEPRDLLMGDEGGPRRVQGEMRRAAGGIYFFSEELHTDFPVERNRDWPREKEIAHAHIRFTFGGSRAVLCE